MFLALAILVGTITPVAMASPPSFAKSSQKFKAHKKFKLKDIKGHWAENAVMEMNSKGFITGYDDYSFKPSNIVTKVETIVMLVRALGLEEDAQEANLTAPFKHAKQIPAWASGYVQVAYELGIISGQDLKSFKPNKGAKRIEVAIMIEQALRVNQCIQNQNRISLRFIDNEDIPRDLQSVIIAMVQNGIMQGTPGNYFLPNKPITRAEMAILLDRIDGKLENEDSLEVRGIITAINEDLISIETGRYTKNFRLDEDIDIYLNGKIVDTDDLKVGYRVKLILGEDRKVIFIKVITTEQETNFEGKITQIVLGTAPTITIKKDNKEYTFKVDSSTEIEIDGNEAFLTELEIGNEIVIKAKDDLALAIIVETEEVREYEGTITGITLGSDATISIENENEKEFTFKVTNEAKIYLDDKSVPLKDLKLGYEVEIKVSDSEVLRIEAERSQKEYEGEFTSITLGNNPAIEIETEDEDKHAFLITEDTRIYLDGNRVDMDELVLGYEVELIAEGNEVVKIKADSDRQKEYEGEIIGLTLGSNSAITIKTDYDDIYTFKVDSDTKIYFEDERVKLEDLQIGYEVEVIEEDDLALKIKAED